MTPLDNPRREPLTEPLKTSESHKKELYTFVQSEYEAQPNKVKTFYSYKISSDSRVCTNETVAKKYLDKLRLKNAKIIPKFINQNKTKNEWLYSSTFTSDALNQPCSTTVNGLTPHRRKLHTQIEELASIKITASKPFCAVSEAQSSCVVKKSTSQSKVKNNSSVLEDLFFQLKTNHKTDFELKKKSFPDIVVEKV